MTTASFTLRPGTPEDALSIIKAHRAAIRGIATGFYSREIIEEWEGPISIPPERVEGFARAIASGEEVVVVAVDSSGLILGFGSIVPSNNELRAVYVRSEYVRKGVGRAILRRLADLAREAGLKELRMDASINAEAFYKANGFSSEAFGEHPMPSGRRMACVRMRRTL
ncbi:MAG TPA: GNAT family N-acetyltransferase [Steroidobacteraceae bacterium]